MRVRRSLAALVLILVWGTASRAADPPPSLVLDSGGHTAIVSEVVFCASGDHVYSVSEDKTVRVWDVSTGDTIRTFYAPGGRTIDGRILATALSPNGRFLAIGGGGYYLGGQEQIPVYLIDVESGLLSRVLSGAKGSVLSLSFSKDGALVAGATIDGQLMVWETRNGAALPPLFTRPDPKTNKRTSIMDVAFSPTDPRLVAFTTHSGMLQVFEIDIGTRQAKPIGVVIDAHEHIGDTQVAWHPEGKELATGGGDQKVRTWILDRNREAPLQVVPEKVSRDLGNQPFSIAYLPGGDEVALAFGYGRNDAARLNPCLLNVRNGEIQSYGKLPERIKNGVARVAVSRDGTLLAFTGFADHSIRVVKAATGEPVQTLGGLPASARWVGWNASGTAIGWDFEGDQPKTPKRPERAFSLADLTLIRYPSEPVLNAVSDSPWATVRVAANDTDIEIVSNGKVRCTLETPKYGGDVVDLTLFTDGTRRVAIATRYGYAAVLDAETGKQIRIFGPHLDEARRVAVSPDGRFLLTSSDDHTVRVWSVEGVTKDEFSGIGVETDSNNPHPSGLRVTKTLRGSGAAAAGILAGDVIASVAEAGQGFTSLAGKDVDTVSLLRGPEGSVVRLEILRGGDGDPVQVTVRRKRFSSDLPRTDPVLSLFVAGDDWIAWTPEGYYACSPGGERLLDWRQDRGFNRLAEFFPAERFHASMYRPDVIRLLHETGDVSRAVERADRDPNRIGPIRGLTRIAEITPPKVRIVSPETASEVQETVNVVAEVASDEGNPARSIALYIDKTLVEVRKSRPSAGPQTVVWEDVTLSPGPHTIQVEARGDKSDGLSEPTTVVGPGVRATRPKMFILSVGVSSLPRNPEPDEKDWTLNNAVPDSRAVAAAFRANCRDLYDVRPAVILNDEDATRAGILDELEKIQMLIKVDDVLVFYFAGHGVVSNGSYFLLTNDADPTRPGPTALSADDLGGRLARTNGIRVVFLDTCHAGKFRTLQIQDVTRPLTSAAAGVYLCGSSLAGEKAWDKSPSPNLGLFAHYLITEMNGVGASVHLERLYFDTRENVTRDSKQKQTPWLKTPEGGNAHPAKIILRR